MSEENVEVVKRSVEAQWRGDIDAFLEELGDDAELDFSRARGPYRGVHRGHEGARELFAGFREAFSSITPLSTEIHGGWRQSCSRRPCALPRSKQRRRGGRRRHGCRLHA